MRRKILFYHSLSLFSFFMRRVFLRFRVSCSTPISRLDNRRGKRFYLWNLRPIPWPTMTACRDPVSRSLLPGFLSLVPLCFLFSSFSSSLYIFLVFFIVLFIPSRSPFLCLWIFICFFFPSFFSIVSPLHHSPS